MCDASSSEDQSVLRSLGEDFTSLIHSGGVLSDASLSNQTIHSQRLVYGSKVDSALCLGEGLNGYPLQQMLYFSSVASLLGSPGQSGYSAANAYLDTLSTSLQHSGLGASSIQWGAWSGGG